jgi:hypothetical protein
MPLMRGCYPRGDQDIPCIYDLEVDGPEDIDTGLVDEDGGSSIMRSPDPIGFLHFEG